MLVTKTFRAIEEFGAVSIILGGGVSANKRLRESLAAMISEQFPEAVFYVPEQSLSTDNALMIAIAAALTPKFAPDPQSLRASGNWRIA